MPRPFSFLSAFLELDGKTAFANYTYRFYENNEKFSRSLWPSSLFTGDKCRPWQRANETIFNRQQLMQLTPYLIESDTNYKWKNLKKQKNKKTSSSDLRCLIYFFHMCNLSNHNKLKENMLICCLVGWLIS